MTLGYKSRDYREKKRWETKKIDIERGKNKKKEEGEKIERKTRDKREGGAYEKKKKQFSTFLDEI